MFQRCSVFSLSCQRYISSLERKFTLHEYEAYRLDKLNDQLAKLQIDNITDPAEMETVLQKVPLLRFNREKSLKMLQAPVIHKQSEEKNAKLWFGIYKWICLPLLIVTGIQAYQWEKKHAEHFDETFSNYIPYPYLRVRNTKMPFGDDQSLFFNPKRNYDPKIHGLRPLKKEQLPD